MIFSFDELLCAHHLSHGMAGFTSEVKANTHNFSFNWNANERKQSIKGCILLPDKPWCLSIENLFVLNPWVSLFVCWGQAFIDSRTECVIFLLILTYFISPGCEKHFSFLSAIIVGTEDFIPPFLSVIILSKAKYLQTYTHLQYRCAYAHSDTHLIS